MAQILTVCRIGAEWGFRDVTGEAFGHSTDIEKGSRVALTDEAEGHLQALKDRTFSEVHLAYRRRTRFILAGRDFKGMGEEYGPQNPVYTIRTMPEKLLRPDGTRAFDTWTGGVLGVLEKQLDDVRKFHREWYLAEAGYIWGADCDLWAARATNSLGIAKPSLTLGAAAASRSVSIAAGSSIQNRRSRRARCSAAGRPRLPEGSMR